MSNGGENADSDNFLVNFEIAKSVFKHVSSSIEILTLCSSLAIKYRRC